MPHLIETYANSKRGNYLINHWLRSLKDNVDLTGVDVLVFDYGLTDRQVELLRERGVVVRRGRAGGRMSNVHYRDLAEYLSGRDYDQVLYVDGGDVIFQSDIRHLFEIHKDYYRAVCEQLFNFQLHRLTLGFGDLKKGADREIENALRGRATINGGFVLAPARRLGAFWDEYSRLCRNEQRHGTDQLIMSYLMYRDGFAPLPERYNFVVITNPSKFTIRRGRFYDLEGNLISVVHNAGRYNVARSITAFGYGEERNQLKVFTHWIMLAMYRSLNWLSQLLRP